MFLHPLDSTLVHPQEPSLHLLEYPQDHSQEHLHHIQAIILQGTTLQVVLDLSHPTKDHTLDLSHLTLQDTNMW